MAENFGARLKHAWNAFLNRDPTNAYRGGGNSYRPDRPRLSYGNERSIIATIYNRIANDVAAIPIQHVRLDQNGYYLETINSGLNKALTTQANIDQTGRALIQDIVLSMFDEGCVAVVSTDTTTNPKISESYDVLELRTAKIIEWYPTEVRVKLYNEQTGKKEEVVLPKSMVAIIENPFYSIVNESNSTLQRLKRKLNILDAIDEQSGSGKLDLIIQLPYTVKSEARRQQVETRQKDIELQLTGSKYGVAYTDATEKIVQLNRPAENNLLTQITYLTNMLYGQLGMSETIFNGTADDKTMLNYNNRTIDPIINAIVEGMKIKFLSKTARSQNQSIMYIRDMFKFVTLTELTTALDPLCRNTIVSVNEIRPILGLKPSKDPKANELSNKNMPVESQVPKQSKDSEEINTEEGGKDNEV